MRSPRIRFAFRLAIALGIADPIAWIDSVDPSVIDCWIEYDALEPIPYPWLQSATIAAEVYRTTAFIAAANGQKIDTRKVSEFMPETADARRPSGMLTTQQMTAWAAGMVKLR